MVTPLSGQTGGACGKVWFLSSTAMVHVRVQHQARFIMARLLYCLGTLFVKQCFGGGASAGLVSRLRK